MHETGTEAVEISKGWAVYVVSCADGTYYTGMTTDVIRRVAEHNSGCGARYTRTRRPVSLLAFAPCEDRAEAMRLEVSLKSRSRRSKERFVREHALGQLEEHK